MSQSLSLPGSTELPSSSDARPIHIDLNSLVLSSDGEGPLDGHTESSYGVHCLLHNDGAVETVLVSTLSSGFKNQTRDVPEEMQQRIEALWRHPHRCITPPVGLSSCETASGSHCLLYIEQLRSSSSLQSMILMQMQKPQRPLYTNKQAIEWLVQLASALTHLHDLSPEVPHGRLSSSVIAVTSAADISLGRCVNASAAHQDGSPTSKRLHVMQPGRPSNVLDPEGEPLVPDSFRPHRCNTPQDWQTFSNMASHRHSTGVSLAFSGSLGSTAPGHLLSMSEASEHSGSQGEGLSVDFSPGSTRSTSKQHQLADRVIRAGALTVDQSFQNLCLSDTKGPVFGGITSTEVPGVGLVFKVSLPAQSPANSTRTPPVEKTEKVEPATWDQSDFGSDVGAELKQHGAGFFGQTRLHPPHQSLSTPLLAMAQGASVAEECHHGASLLAHASAPLFSGGSSDTEPGLSNASTADGAVAASGSPGRLGRSQGSLNGIPAAFSRSVVRQHSDSTLLSPFRDAYRASDDGVGGPRSPAGDRSSGAKRTRSGLSQRLPSLVELPGAEARGAAMDADVDCHSPQESVDNGMRVGSSTSTTILGSAAHTNAECVAVNAAHAGLLQLSSSSPEDPVQERLAEGELVAPEGHSPPGDRLASALARLRYAAPALTRVRLTALSAASATGPPRSGRAHGASKVAESAAALQDSSRTGEEKQRGGLSVMQLLQNSDENLREKWHGKLISRRTSCSGDFQATDKCHAPSHIGRWHDDLPYLAPEMLQGGELCTAADCFAFGVIMYEVLKRELVASEIAMHADLNDLPDAEALRWHVLRIADGERPHLPVSWPLEVREIIQLCWQDNPFKRPSMAHVHASLLHFQSHHPM